MTTGVAKAVEARDARGHTVDVSPITRLLDSIVAKWHPHQVWLFGSRARGQANASSDWDLFAVVPDDVPDDELDAIVSWRLRKESGTRADVVPCHLADFREDHDTPNTIAYEVAHEGVLIYER